MKNTLEEAKSVLAKAKDDMARYYNQRRAPAPTFAPGNKVYLDSSNIQTTRPLMKLSHCCLGPYQVECSVRRFAYRLTLPHSMRRLHPVFNVVKLTPARPDPIVGRRRTPPPPLSFRKVLNIKKDSGATCWLPLVSKNGIKRDRE